VQGKNDFQRAGWGGPCPPPGLSHRYFFKLYALDQPLALDAGMTKREVARCSSASRREIGHAPVRVEAECEEATLFV